MKRKYHLRNCLILFTFFWVGMNTSLLADISSAQLDKDFIRVERESKKSSGYYFGLKENDRFKRYEIKFCQFLYEKGLGEHPQDSREIAYERFMVSFSGIDKKGVSSFDSVLYGHSDYSAQFKRLDLSKSFAFRPFKRVDANDKDQLGQVKATRNQSGELFLTFRHQEVFDSANSSFFEKGEQRDYEIKVHFTRFDPKVIQLSKVSVETYKTINGKKRKKIVEVLCNEFKEPEV
jgi:hypothetical protein